MVYEGGGCYYGCISHANKRDLFAVQFLGRLGWSFAFYC